MINLSGIQILSGSFRCFTRETSSVAIRSEIFIFTSLLSARLEFSRWPTSRTVIQLIKSRGKTNICAYLGMRNVSHRTDEREGFIATSLRFQYYAHLTSFLKSFIKQDFILNI